MSSSTITLRLDSAEKEAIAAYAKTFGLSVSEFMRHAALSKIEDDLDIRIAVKALADHHAHPRTYCSDEIESEFL